MRLGTPYFPFFPHPPMSKPYKYSNRPKNAIPIQEPIKQSSDCNPPFLEIFGISLDFDDILILGLLFFLYIEGVEDQLLYIILIILLLEL